MNIRVSNNAFIHAVHGCSFATTTAKFINAEWVCYIVNQLFDGGMIFPNHSNNQGLSKVFILTPHAKIFIHHSPFYFINHWKSY